MVRCHFGYLDFGYGPLPKDVQREVRAAVQRPGWWMELPRQRRAIVRQLVVVGAYVILAQSPFLLSLIRPKSFPHLYTIPALLVTFPLAMMLMTSYGSHALSDRQRRFLARHVALRGYCGSCGYKLPETIDVDGFYVCPECGSSWDRGSPGAGLPP